MKKLTYNVPVSNYRNLENWIHRKLAEAGEGGSSSELLPPPEDGIMLPDKAYSYGEIENAEFELASPVGLYHWIFECTSDSPQISFPTGIIWANGEAPTIELGYIYEISVYNNLGVFASYPIPGE